MKKTLVYIFFISIAINSISQNLIPNHSFEARDKKNIKRPLYLNRINSIDYKGNNHIRFPKPHSGKNLIGMRIRKGHKEFIYIKIDSTLTKNCKYNLSFYVLKADNKKFNVDNFGAYFSKNKPDRRFKFLCGIRFIPVLNIFSFLFNSYPLKNIPQMEIVKDGGFTDTKNWERIEGSYIAQGDENYITIGYFLKNEKLIASDKYIDSFRLFSDDVYAENKEAYYFMDDFKLVNVINDTLRK